MTTVSVVISTYNYAEVLPFSVNSALRQTHTPLEVLVVGDGCTDNSAEVVGAIDDPRVRFINLERRAGSQAGPNNEGIRQARGEVIAYLGHDDLWFPQHVERLVQQLETAGGIASDRALFIWPDGHMTIYPRSHSGSVPVASAMAHLRQLTFDHDLWWRVPDVSHQPPDYDFYRRAAAKQPPVMPLQRLGVLKLHASARPGVYTTRPTNEQAHWQARLEEPDLEAEVALAAVLSGELDDPLAFAHRLPARTLVGGTARILAQQAWWLVAQRFGPSGASRAHHRLRVIGAPLAASRPKRANVNPGPGPGDATQ